MSRIGKKTIPIPEGVKLSVEPGCFEVSGPKGKVRQVFPEIMLIEVDEQAKLIKVKCPDEERQTRAFQGLTRSLLANAVAGVTEGFKKTLEIVGTGYNARLKGKHLELQMGFCLPQILMIPEGIEIEVPMPTKIHVKGSDKQLVGQFAANIRAIRPPDSYKGKGIRYEGEVIKLKAGKSFAASG